MWTTLIQKVFKMACTCGDPDCAFDEEIVLSSSGGITSGMTSQSASHVSLIDLFRGRLSLENELKFSVEGVSRRLREQEFLHEDIILAHESLDSRFKRFLFKEDDHVVILDIGSDGKGSFTVCGSDREKARAFLHRLEKKYLEDPKPSTDEQVRFGFWFLGRNGPSYARRPIDAPSFEDISRNYSASAWENLARLGSLEQLPEDAGRIILMHGIPGSGKSTALRGLSRAWRKWADFDVVTDPEALLGDASYLMQVVSSSRHYYDPEDDSEDQYDEEKRAQRWRVLLLEDSGELVQKDAKERTGQGLSRLFNMADGILGRGTRIIFVLTTNEPLSALHPAIIRPGRCLANFEVPALSADEASAWLGRRVANPTTLADLFAEAQNDPVLQKAVDSFEGNGVYI